ncbi:gem-associated protein 7-like [Leguminivora glycinivorella]|uniref:gem-associated protein 7-like n=1 Tax=Leguminivora glycinivorella TaxID=1035111 RepID=UPI00200F228E|nr:gem-associated protein 7-like [Leguminivora glycinivorella]
MAMSNKLEISSAEQEARAKLREKFLHGISELRGQSCTILTYEQTELNASFTGWQPDGTELLVQDLKTPASTIPNARLRTPDVLAIHFDTDIQLP